jgi:uncharacterized membrane protein YfcA
MEFDLFLVLASFAALLVGISKGGLPFVGMMSVPVLSMVMSPVKAAVLLLPIYIISDVVGVWLYRRSFSAFNLKILIPASMVGILIGWLTASMISELTIKFLIGLLGVVFCLKTWLKIWEVQEPEPASVPKGLVCGALSGFTSFISHAGGPPFQIFVLPQKLSKSEFAGTATIFFAIINLAKIVPYQNLIPYQKEDLVKAIVLIPFALIGTFLGAYLTRRIADEWFFKFIQMALFLVSLKLIWDAVHG